MYCRAPNKFHRKSCPFNLLDFGEVVSLIQSPVHRQMPPCSYYLVSLIKAEQHSAQTFVSSVFEIMFVISQQIKYFLWHKIFLIPLILHLQSHHAAFNFFELCFYMLLASARLQCRFWKQECDSEEEWVPLFSRRPVMLWEPALTTDKSTVPEAMSSINDFAVSKLLFMVVAITPVGPVFSHPLQYKPKKKHGLTAFVFFSAQVALCKIFSEYTPAACWTRPLMLGMIALRESNGTDGSMRVLL